MKIFRYILLTSLTCTLFSCGPDELIPEPVPPVVNPGDKDEPGEEPEQPEQYEVQQGDTLLEISRRKYGTDQMVKEICAANGLEDSDKIYVGQTIVLP